MSERILQIVTTADWKDELAHIADAQETIFHWGQTIDGDRLYYHLLTTQEKLQNLVDALQQKFGDDEDFHLMVQPVEAYLRKTEEPTPKTDREADKQRAESTILREAMEKELEKGAAFDRNYVLLVLFSTIVAAIGLIENNVAVLVGAMVIAPFLGPNLALTFAAAMGNWPLAWKSVKTLIGGSLTAFSLATTIGFLWPFQVPSMELNARAVVDYSSIILALASGAAAVLSLTKGISSVLVGVMVAVALLPPLTAAALFIGQGMFTQAASALLLLAVNIVCVNLSGLLMFLFKGIGPRSWWDKRNARRAVYWFIAFWGSALVGLAAIINWWR